MLDQSAELAENRKLDAILSLLERPQNDVESEFSDSDTEEKCYEFSAESSEDEVGKKALLSESIPHSTRLKSTRSTISTLTNLMCHISYEQFDLITECQDPDLKELLILNRSKHVLLKNLITKYKQLAVQGENSLRAYMLIKLKQMETLQGNKRIGFPYFHIDFFPPANNPDFFRKKANKEINFAYIDLIIRWTKLKVKALKTSVLFSHYENKLIHYENNLSDLRKKQIELMENEDNVTKMEKAGIEKQISNLEVVVEKWRRSVDNIQPPELGDDTFISWTVIAERDFHDVNLAAPLKGLWNSYLHPGLNNTILTTEEFDKIEKLVKQKMDWKSIANALNNKRSEYNLCSAYMSNTNLENFTQSLDLSDINMKFLEEQRVKPSFSQYKCVGNTSVTKLFYSRYRYMKSMANCKLGAFSYDEDLMLQKLISKWGTDFDKIAEKMPTRSKAQIKARYDLKFVKDDAPLGSFQIEEDIQIIDHVKKNGEQNWPLLSNQMKRNPSQVRHRYRIIKKHLENNVKVEDIPRRTLSHRMKEEMKRQRAIKLSITKGMDCVAPNVRMRTAADKQLVGFFAPTGQLRKTRVIRSVSQRQLDDCANTILALFKTLNVRLTIPDEFDETYMLDKIDYELLYIIKNSQNSSTSHRKSKLNELIPPNVSSAQTMRALLMNQLADSDTDEPVTISKEEMNVECVKLFAKRFKSFLKWPALMSTITPSISLENEDLIEEVVAPPKKRPVGRPRKKRKKDNNCAHKFEFQDGKLTEIKQPDVLNLRVVDPATIQKLKEQNRLKNITPIKLIPNKGKQPEGSKTTYKNVKVVNVANLKPATVTSQSSENVNNTNNSGSKELPNVKPKRQKLS